MAKTAKSTKKPTAVICDDDAMTRTISRAVLERAGFEVLAGVGTAMEALQLVLTYEPDVLLLDLVLPAMSGEEVIGPIRTGVPSCTIVVFSAFDPSAAIKNGALYVVPKGESKRLDETLARIARQHLGLAAAN